VDKLDFRDQVAYQPTGLSYVQFGKCRPRSNVHVNLSPYLVYLVFFGQFMEEVKPIDR